MRVTIASINKGIPVAMGQLVAELKPYIREYDIVILPKIEDSVIDLNKVKRFAYNSKIPDYNIVTHMYSTGEIMAFAYNTKKYVIKKVDLSDGFVSITFTYKKQKKNFIVGVVCQSIENRNTRINDVLHILEKLKYPRVVFGELGFLTTLYPYVNGTTTCECCLFSVYHKDRYIWRGCVNTGSLSLQYPGVLPGIYRNFDIVTFNM